MKTERSTHLQSFLFPNKKTPHTRPLCLFRGCVFIKKGFFHVFYMCISIKYWLLTKSDTWMQFLLILESFSEKLKPGENLLQNRMWPVRSGVRQLKIFSCITSIALGTSYINLLKKKTKNNQKTAIQPLM